MPAGRGNRRRNSVRCYDLCVPLRELLRSQKNDVFGAINDAGLDPRDFRWGDDLSETMSLRRVMPSDPLTVEVLRYDRPPYSYFFRFDVESVVMSPGEDTIVERFLPTNWPARLSVVVRWLRCLKRELDAASVDLWEALKYERVIPAAASQEKDNTLFTPVEARRIAESLRQIPEFAETLGLTQEQLKNLTSGVEYLVDASNRLGRKDWLNNLTGVFMAYFLTAALPPETARQIFYMTGQVLHWLFGHPLLPT